MRIQWSRKLNAQKTSQNSEVDLPQELALQRLYPSDLKMPDSEPHILFQFKEKNTAE
jgi:hypothetical protein